jgi:hypothetical protein
MYSGLSKHGNKSMSQAETNRNNIAFNQDALLKNKAEISERRESIFANRRAMSENRRNI